MRHDWDDSCPWFSHTPIPLIPYLSVTGPMNKDDSQLWFAEARVGNLKASARRRRTRDGAKRAAEKLAKALIASGLAGKW